MLVVVQNTDLDAKCLLDRSLYRIDRSVTYALNGALGVMSGKGKSCNGCECAALVLLVCDLAFFEVHRLFSVQVVCTELVHDLLRSYLALLLCNLLDNVSKLFVHSLRKTESVEGIHDEGYAALAGLAVDADNRLVLASDITRIDRQVRNLPDAIGSLLKRLHTLADRILMGTGKCGKYQLACIRMSRVNGHLCAALTNLGDLLYIFQI